MLKTAIPRDLSENYFFYFFDFVVVEIYDGRHFENLWKLSSFSDEK